MSHATPFPPKTTCPIDSSHIATARRASRRSMAVCLGGALALNLTALGVVAAAVHRWDEPLAERRHTAWVTVIPHEQPATAPRLASLPAPAVASAAAPAMASALTPPLRAEKAIDSKPQQPLPEPVPTTLPLPSTNEALGEDPSARFYGFKEVDRPAEPDSDWNLNPAALDAIGVTSLVFDIFIGRDGEVIDCTVVEPTSLPDETRRQLEDRLRQTVLKPAWRHDVTVASVRRIEVSVAAPGS